MYKYMIETREFIYKCEARILAFIAQMHMHKVYSERKRESQQQRKIDEIDQVNWSIIYTMKFTYIVKIFIAIYYTHKHDMQLK